MSTNSAEREPVHLTSSDTMTEYQLMVFGYKNMVQEQTEELAKLLGEIASKKLRDMSQQMLYKPMSYKQLVDGPHYASKIVKPEKIKPNQHEYFIRNYFASIVNDWIIFLSTFTLIPACQTLPSSKRTYQYSHIVQIDFLLADYFMEDVDALTYSYKHKRKSSELDGKGLFTNSMCFLRDLYTFVCSIDENCLIRVLASDKQRERIYRRALKDMRNIVFESGKK